MKIGDKVTRLLAGVVPHELEITDITADRIICGDWEFCSKTGVEIDDYLEWGPAYGKSGSYIKNFNKKESQTKCAVALSATPISTPLLSVPTLNPNRAPRA